MKMMNKFFAVILSVAFFSSSSFCFATGLMDKSEQSASSKDFSLETVGGKTVTLSDFKGKSSVLLFFFATWCPWCRKKLPELIKNESKYKKEGIELLLIDAGETQSKVASFAEKQEVPFDILLDKDTKVAEDYDIVGVPTLVLISKAGNIVYSGNDIPDNYRKLLGE